MRKVTKRFTKVRTKLPARETESKPFSYHFHAWIFKDGKVDFCQCKVFNDKKKMKFLARYVRRAAKCKRFLPCDPLDTPLQVYDKLKDFLKENNNIKRQSLYFLTKVSYNKKGGLYDGKA